MTQSAHVEALQPLNPQTEIDLMTQEWTPELLNQQIARETQMRSIVVKYCQDNMKEGHHFYNLPGQNKDRKPSVSKEGALNLCSLFKVTPQPDEPHETFHDDGHYTVRSRVHLVSGRSGAILATGDGTCSTRESKYAYRWVFGNEVPAHLDKEKLPAREVGRNERKYKQYRVENEDLADTYNTVLKMSAKRAIVDATLKLPLVSELFTQDLEEQIADNQAQIAEAKAGSGQSKKLEAAEGRPADPKEEQRDRRGQGIAAMGLVARKGNFYQVTTPSLQGKQQTFDVARDEGGKVRCTCPEYQTESEKAPGYRCEHILAAKHAAINKTVVDAPKAEGEGEPQQGASAEAVSSSDPKMEQEIKELRESIKKEFEEQGWDEDDQTRYLQQNHNGVPVEKMNLDQLIAVRDDLNISPF